MRKMFYPMVLMLLVFGLASHAGAQNGDTPQQSNGIAADGDGTGAEAFDNGLDLDPEVGVGDGAYTSTPVGKRKKWELDKGHFESDEKLTGVKSPDEFSDDYSGIRLRRPKPH